MADRTKFGERLRLAWKVLRAGGDVLQQWRDIFRRGGPVPVSSSSHSSEQAMRISAISACVRLVAGNVAKLPVHVYRMTGDDARRRDRAHPIEYLLNKRPNRWQTAHEFRRMLTAQTALHGNAYALKERDELGDLSALIPLDCNRMRVEQPRFAEPPVYYYTAPGSAERPYLAEDIFHLRDLTLDGICGLSRIAQAQLGISLTLASERYAYSYFVNGAEPGLAIEMPGDLDDEQRRKYLDAWQQSHGGPDKAHAPVIVWGGSTVKQLTLSNKDSQFLELRSFQVEDIARLYGVPAHLIGLSEKQTSWGTGVEQMSLGFWQFHLFDWAIMWDSAAGRDLLSPIGDRDAYVEHLFDAHLRADYKTRMEGYGLAIQNGILSPNEVRRKENLEPREGGDEFWKPSNMAGELPEPAPAPPPQLPGDSARHAWQTKVRSIERYLRARTNGENRNEPAA